jgi:hypothetical protein
MDALLQGKEECDVMTGNADNLLRTQMGKLPTPPAQLGGLRSVIFVRLFPAGGETYRFQFEHGAVEYQVFLNAARKINAFGVRLVE